MNIRVASHNKNKGKKRQLTNQKLYLFRFEIIQYCNC